MKNFFLILCSIFLFFACDSASLYMVRENNIVVHTLEDGRLLTDRSLLDFKADLSPEIQGLPEDQGSIRIQVALRPILPVGSFRRSVTANKILVSEYFLGDGTTATSIQDDVYTDAPTELSEFEESEKAGADALKEASLSDEGAGSVGAGSKDAGDEVSPNAEVSKEASKEAFKEADYLEEADEASPMGEAYRSLLAEPQQKVGLSSLDGLLPAFALPEGLASGPYSLEYEVFNGNVLIHSSKLRFYLLDLEKFSIESLIAYPPGPNNDQIMLPAHSKALFELAFSANKEKDPWITWMLGKETLGAGHYPQGRLLQSMPEESGLYTLKAFLYPEDPNKYPDFPLPFLFHNLAIAVSPEVRQENYPEIQQVDTALVYALRGSLESNVPTLGPLQAVNGGEPIWQPLRNDFGLYTGGKEVWHCRLGDDDERLALWNGPIRILWNGAILEDGSFFSGSLEDGKLTLLKWTLSFISDSFALIVQQAGSEENTFLFLGETHIKKEEPFSVMLDFEAVQESLFIRLSTGEEQGNWLALPDESRAVSAMELVLGAAPADRATPQGSAVVHHIAIAKLASFYESLKTDSYIEDEEVILAF